MANTSTIDLSSLDVDALKNSFIQFLQTQPIFKDYVYDGSNINVLLDLLSKNSNANAFLLNMLASESFLDSAILRDSVVSHAKHLNYLPRSWRSAYATIDVEITVANSNPTVITVPSGTSFTSRSNNQVYSFVTNEDISTVASQYIPLTNSYVYSFSNVTIYEGTFVTEQFYVDNTIDNQIFTLSNQQIDTNSIEVSVITSNTNNTSTVFSFSDSLRGIKASSNVYFLQAGQNERYEVLFGDGVLGVKPITGNIISVNYRVCNGSEPNGCETFQLGSNDLGGYSDYTISTIVKASGGAESETLESIKFAAPRHYQTQESAIATPDYSTLIQSEFPEIRAINVYGGDEVFPPRYGYVLISVELENFDGIPRAKKSAIESFIQPKMAKTFRPLVISPDFLYIEITAEVDYSLNLTTSSVDDITTIVTNAISSFNDSELNNFNVKYRNANLTTDINESDPSIVGLNLTTRIYQKIIPKINTAYSTSLNFQNELNPNTVSSSSFTYNNVNAFLKDDGNGNIYVATLNGTTTSSLTTFIGNIDYTTGIMNISNLLVSDFVGSEIRIYAETTKQDISVSQNVILQIGSDASNITVNPIRS